MNDLMNHDFGEFEFLVFFICNALRDHTNTLAVAGHAGPTIEGIGVVILPIQSTDMRGFANTPVSPRSSSVILPSKIERLQEE